MCIGVIDARFETEPRFFLPSSNNNNKSNADSLAAFSSPPFVIDPSALSFDPRISRISNRSANGSNCTYFHQGREIPSSREEARNRAKERAGWATIVRI